MIALSYNTPDLWLREKVIMVLTNYMLILELQWNVKEEHSPQLKQRSFCTEQINRQRTKLIVTKCHIFTSCKKKNCKYNTTLCRVALKHETDVQHSNSYSHLKQ
jgi:hypothetical protein